jgi:hypothetical protein
LGTRSSREKSEPPNGIGDAGVNAPVAQGGDGGSLRRLLLIAVSVAMTGLALAVAVELALMANATHNPPWVDWATYSNALGRLSHGASPYDVRQLTGPYHLLDMSDKGAFGYAYPPASLVLFAPFGSQPIGLVLWLGLNVGLLVSGVFAILRRELGRDAIQYLGVAILPVVLWIGFIEGLTAGNVTVGLSGVLAWSWAIGRGRTAPAAIAVIGVAKVFPAILVCWTTPPRLIRSAVTAGLIAGAWILITLPLVGVGAWVDFFRAMGNAQPNCESYPSVACVLQPVVGIGPAKIAAVGLAGTLGIGAVFVRRDLPAFTLIAVAWVVPAYNMSFYSMLPLFVVWVVVFAIAMRRLRSVEFRRPGSPSRRLAAETGPQSGR